MPNLNPIHAVGALGNSIGSVFGNNTYGQSRDVFGDIPTVPAVIQTHNAAANYVSPYAGNAAGPRNAYEAQLSAQAPSQSSGPVTDPAVTAAAAADARARASSLGVLNSQLGQLDPQQAIGLQNIANSYNLSSNRLNEQKATNERDYNTSTGQNNQSYSNNRTGILNNTRNQANALQRLLGINGAGNSSAAYEQAPYLAGQQGTQQLTGAQQTFSNNQSALDTNWQDAQRQYSNAFDDLGRQKFQQENGLKQSIAQSRAGLLGQIANINGGGNDYQSQIGSLLNQITQLGNQYANPVMKEANVSYQAPNLSNYFLNTNLGQGAAPAQAAGGAASELSPTFLGLLGDRRDQFGQPLA
jgi:hypothetical protein